MLPSSGAAMFRASGPKSDQPASSKTTARSRMSRPCPPYSAETCGAKTPASRAACCSRARSSSPPALATPAYRSSSAEATVRTKAAVRAARSRTLGSGVRSMLIGHSSRSWSQGLCQLESAGADPSDLLAAHGHPVVGALAAQVPDVELPHDDRRLPAAERLVPGDRLAGQVLPDALGVARHRLVAGGQTDGLEARDSVGGDRTVRPVVEQRAEIGERIAERRHVPVEDRRDHVR